MKIKILLNDNFFFMAPSVIHTALSLLKYLEYEDIELMGAGLF